MIVRLRSRDGLERVKVGDDATVGELRRAIETITGVKENEQRLSTDVKLLSGKEDESASVACLSGNGKKLQALGVKNGSMLYLKYGFERDVPAAARCAATFSDRRMTVAEMVAKQTRIERQEKADCVSVSIERHAANAFQLYVNQGIAFSVKRCGVMYGSVDEDKNVKVEFIYEPPQDGSQEEILVHSNGEEALKVETIVSLLGLQKVGYIFSQSSKEKDYLISTQELMEMADRQAESGSETFVTAVVSLYHSDEGADVHFEAYQCTNQCVKLRTEGWFCEKEDTEKHSGVSTLKDPREPSKEKPVIVAGKDTARVDNEWFLCPVKILDHEGLLSSDFPIENRMTPQGTGELKAYLKQMASKPFVTALSDFHLLLYLAKNSNMDATTWHLLSRPWEARVILGKGTK